MQIDSIFDRVVDGIRYDQLQNYFSDLRFSTVAFEGLAGIFFTMNKAGPKFDNDLQLTMQSLSAVSELFSRTKTAGLNLYSSVETTFPFSSCRIFVRFRSYHFAKQMTKTFNPNLLQMPIFRTLDIAIPVLTPLLNFDQLISLITGLPRGTIDNIVHNVDLVNNFLTTPGVSKVTSKFSFNRNEFFSSRFS